MFTLKSMFVDRKGFEEVELLNPSSNIVKDTCILKKNKNIDHRQSSILYKISFFIQFLNSNGLSLHVLRLGQQILRQLK